LQRFTYSASLKREGAGKDNEIAARPNMYQMCGARPLYKGSFRLFRSVNNVNFAYPESSYALPASTINLRSKLML
jgi:hypothetical protein